MQRCDCWKRSTLARRRSLTLPDLDLRSTQASVRSISGILRLSHVRGESVNAMPSPIVLGAVTMAESEPDQRIVEALTVPSPPSRRDQRLWVPVEVVHEDVVYQAFLRHDSGAQKSFVSEKFVNRLGLNIIRKEGFITGGLEDSPASPRMGELKEPIQIKCGEHTARLM